MYRETGKTLRRTPNYAPEEGYLSVKSENQGKKSVNIFDNEFHCGLPYSIKKRKRWNISSILSDSLKDDNTEEQTDYQPVTYCMIRTLDNKSNYVLDSISRKEIGTRDISESTFPKKSLNYRSILKELKKSNNQTDNDYYKSSKKKKNPKQSNTNVRSMNNSNLSPKENISVQEKDIRNESVYINEYYNYNNEITPITPYTYKVLNKEKKCRIKKLNEYEIESDYESDYNDDEDLEETSGYNNNKKAFQLIEYDVTQPIATKKSRKRKSRKMDINTDQDDQDDQDDWTGISNIADTEDFVMYDRDDLPFLLIEETCDSLKEEIREISGSFHCWISDSSPVAVLIDINEWNCGMDRNYIILKPQSVKNNIASIKVILNISKLDLHEVLTKDFQNIKQIIEFLQLKFGQEKDLRSVMKNEYYELEKPVEQLLNTWEIKPIKSIKPLFCFNEEWQKFEFNNNLLNEILGDKDSECLKGKAVCNICSNIFPGKESTLMKECQHQICENCLNYHIVDLLKKSVPTLTCPVNKCQTILDCASILSVIHFPRYREKLEVFEGEFLRKDCSRCDYCAAVVILREKKAVSQTQLEYVCVCNKIICGYCGGSQHWPTSCANMKIHNVQTVKLNDNKIKPVKLKLFILSGRPCPNCKEFVCKTKGNKFLKCICQMEFCYTCGKVHEYQYRRKVIKCIYDINNLPLTYDLTKYNPCPNPDSARSKYYCESMNIRLLSHPANVGQLKKKLMKIDIKIKNYKNLDVNYESSVAQYSQILSVIESIYVSLYQMKRKENPKFRNVLQISAKSLMFFLYKLDSITNELDAQVRRKEKNNIKIDEISRKREMFNTYLKEALDFVTKLQILIR